MEHKMSGAPKIDKEMEEILSLCYLDDQLFMETLLPEIFDVAFSSLHTEIFENIKRQENGRRGNALCLAPRGLGKTSIAKGIAIKEILFNEKHFIVYVSNTHTLAEMQTENIKRELLANTYIRKLFGNVKDAITTGIGVEGLDETFSKSAWVAFGRTLVLPRGCGQQIRGLNWNNHRPDLIILDDPENAQELRNEDIRINNRRWFFGDVMPSGSRVRKNLDVLYLDTKKHEDCLPMTLMNMPDWRSIRLAICDHAYKSLAPDFMSDEEIFNLIESYRQEGTLDIFYQEYMNESISLEGAAFKPDYFQDFHLHSLPLDELRGIEWYIILDPAKTLNPNSAESAIVVVGVNRVSQKIYVQDIYAEKAYPDQVYDQIFRFAADYNVRNVGIEVTGLNMFITYPFRNEIAKRGLPIDLIELKAIRKKEERIGALIPLYRTGHIYHNPVACKPLENQLLTFPNSRRFDIMDALAYIVEFFDIGGIGFSKDLEYLPGTPASEILEQYRDEPMPKELIAALEGQHLELRYNECGGEWRLR